MEKIYYIKNLWTKTHNTWDVGRVVVNFNETNNEGWDEVIMNYNGAWKADSLWRHEFAIYGYSYKLTIHLHIYGYFVIG